MSSKNKSQVLNVSIITPKNHTF